MRERSGSYFTTLQTNPTAAQKPAAAEGNTTHVRRHIRGVVSEITVRHRRQAELAVRAHIARLHRTITNRHKRKANPLCSFLVSVVVVLAAAACDSRVTTRACCHHLPISVPDRHHAVSLRFCSGSAVGIFFGSMLLPIPLF